MSESLLEIELSGESLYLLPQKAVYRPSLKQLILSDVHLGKGTHFRKQGLPLPHSSHLKDIDTLHFLFDKWEPMTVLILGDLFHSDYNKEWLWFKSLLLQYPYIQFILIEGNHDILEDEHYALKNLFKTERLEDEHFIFSHHPTNENQKINFCGHIHPGVRIEGTAKQSEKLPCFYFCKQQFILPAFGYLTGLQILKPEAGARCFLVAGVTVVELKKY
ncbi:MAG: ligase-associated DNA damage response endonuclease PdeM [Bacteroidetes bacterium]|nr:ligase-associated DNA damage response endonuclease PdeM [Bacteroidota bacterium]